MKARVLEKLFGTVAVRATAACDAGGGGYAAAGGIRGSRAGGYALRMVMGFVMTQASVLGGLSPFGVAFVAAQRTSGQAVFAALGAALGYIVSNTDSGLRYIAVCVLTLTAYTLLDGMAPSRARRPSLMPMTAFAFNAVTGVIYWLGHNSARGGRDAAALVLLVTELLLTLGCGILFQSALARAQGGGSDGGAFSGAASVFGSAEFGSKRAGGILAIGACTLLALSGIVVGDILSPARMAAVCAVMLCARRGGVGAGAASGLCMGLVMDLGIGAPFYSMSYGSAGMISGVFKRAGKFWTAISFVCTGAVSALWALSGPHRLSVLLEAFAASVIFMLIPDGAFAALGASLKTPENVMRAERVRRLAHTRLTRAAEAFSNVYGALGGVFSDIPSDDEDIEGVFDRATKEVCGQCARVSQCWDAELPATCAAIRDAAKRCRERGRLDKNDLSGYFAVRCIRFKQLLAVCNRELTAMLYKRQYAARVREGRGVLCRQYAVFAGVLARQAGELAAIPENDAAAERRLSRWLQTWQLSPRVSVYPAANGRMCAELEGENLSILLTDKRELARGAARALGWMVNEPEEAGVASLDRLTLWESEPVMATLGVAAHKRGGQPVSGDSGAYFKTDDGVLYVILADGMGSGAEAAADSREAVGLLEGFLRAGLEPLQAMESMNTSLLLKSGGGALFVTLDLLSVDLMRGRLSSFKYGAAPTYLLRGGEVSRVTCETLPGGMENGRAPDIFSQEMDAEQWVVMISDGVADAHDDAWLTGAVAELGGDAAQAPRDAAAYILRQAMRRGGAFDDMTAMVLRTKKR